MTIVVGYLWTAPPKEATVLEDGSVAWPGVRRTVGDSERVAIEFAKGLAEATDQRLVGVTVGDAIVTVDDQPVSILPNGSFQTTVAIPRDGIYTLTITATDRRGKTNLVQRSVHVRE